LLILHLLALISFVGIGIHSLARGGSFLVYESILRAPFLRYAIHLAIPAFGIALTILVMVLFKRERASASLYYGLSQLFQFVFQGLSTGLMVLDSKGRVRYINPACSRLLGRFEGPLPQLVHYSQLVEPLLVPIAERLAASIESGERFSREYRVFLPSGVRCMECDFYTFHDFRLGKVNVVTLEDRTREDEIKQKLSQQLEETHRYATSKDNFFANMSHEIRTPINAILGMTYFAKRNCPDHKGIEYIEKIENASELLLSVVNDILDFSKMQEHKFSLNPENFNLFDVKKIILDLFTLKVMQKGLTFLVEFNCPERFYVLGDQFRLTQVFINLVSNAIKFTEQGLVSVSLNHEQVGQDIILRCAVRDTGVGISEDETAKLFTDFEQFGHVLIKKHEGTGLGLAICKRLVELMHGVIWVDSVPGKGSSFHFIVVLKKPLEVPGEALSAGIPKIARKTGRVLIVEDNDINGEIAQTLLENAGCVIERARDGLEAVELCRAHPRDYYDLVLMDIHMPRMNGYDAARALKTDIGLDCPIVAVTATSENSETLEKHSDVIAGYIVKPYDPEVFRGLFGD
jgi:signal transduction histidine kinase